MAKTQRDTLNQQVYEHLLHAVINGELPGGTQLDERTLSKEIGVSRTPLRGAISQLVREGLVEYYPYRGNFVKAWTKKEIEDLFEVRMALEALAVRLAIPKLSNEDIEHLRQILTDVEVALRDEDLEEFGEADARFHRFISQKTTNDALISMLDRMSLQLKMIRALANQDPNVVERTLHERPRILAALETRDADAAARLMREHIDGVRQAVIDQLDEA